MTAKAKRSGDDDGSGVAFPQPAILKIKKAVLYMRCISFKFARNDGDAPAAIFSVG